MFPLTAIFFQTESSTKDVSKCACNIAIVNNSNYLFIFAETCVYRLCLLSFNLFIASEALVESYKSARFMYMYLSKRYM